MWTIGPALEVRLRRPSHIPAMSNTNISVGDKVKWSWGNGSATGEAVERFESDVERTIDGNAVKREASQDEPAFLIEQEDGQKVLKSSTELEKA